MAAKDFLADRLKSQKIITKGTGYPELAIYSSNSEGYTITGDLNQSVLSQVGSNVFFFVSGSIGSVQSNSMGTSLFGGDVYISGSLYTESLLTTSGIDSSEDINSAKNVKINSSFGLYTDNIYKADGSPWDFLTVSNISNTDISFQNITVDSITTDTIKSNSNDGLKVYLDNDSTTDSSDGNASFEIYSNNESGLNNNPIFEIKEDSSFFIGSTSSLFPRIYTLNTDNLVITSPGNLILELDNDDSTDNNNDINSISIRKNNEDLFKVLDTGDIETKSGSTLTVTNIVGNLSGDVTGNLSGLVNDIDVTALKTDTENDILALQADIDQNEADADSAISAIDSAYKAADSVLTSDLAAEVSRATAAEAALQADIDQNEADADSAISAIDTAYKAADSVLTSGLAAEVSRATAAEAALQADIDQNEADANSAISAIDTAYKAADSVLTSDLAAEVSRATAAEAALQADIDQNEADADSAISAIDSAYKAADSVLTSGLAAEVSRATAAEAALQADIDQNEADADSAISAIDTAYKAADSVLTSDLAAEVSRAIAAEAALQADIDQNEADADSAIALVQTNLDAESSARQSADSTLQTAIDNLQADVNQNEADADSAIALVQSNIDAESSARQSADSTLQSNIDIETTARIAAVNDLNDLYVNIRQSSGLNPLNGKFKLSGDTDAFGYKQSGDDVIYFIQPDNVPMPFVQALAKLDEQVWDNLSSISTLDPAGTVVDLSAIKSRLGLDTNNDIAQVYSSIEFILHGDSHNSAIGKLDSALSNRINTLNIFNIPGIPSSSQDNDGKILLYNNDGNTESFTYVDPQTGPQGNAATINIGTVSVGAPNTTPIVTNSGDQYDAVFNFVIPKGVDGTDGTDGTDGADGKSWYSGILDPSSSNPGGNNGDFFLNTNTSDVFIKAADQWPVSPNFNIKGLQGIQGETGPQGPQGDSAYEVWQNLSGNSGKSQSEFITDITGQDGQPGADGSDGKTWYSDSSNPTISDPGGNNGDFFLNTNTSDVFIKAADQWPVSPNFNIKGLQGIQGETGPQGQPGAAADNSVIATNLSTDNTFISNVSSNNTLQTSIKDSLAQDSTFQSIVQGEDAPTITSVDISNNTITTNLSDSSNVSGTFSANLGNLSNVSDTTPGSGQVLKWNSSNNEWQPSNESGGSQSSGSDITLKDGINTITTVEEINFENFATIVDTGDTASGNNIVSLTGVIGSDEDGLTENAYQNGLFEDFQTTTRIGTVVDRFNEVLKALAPSPAPSLDQFDVNAGNGITAKLSFGDANIDPSYANVNTILSAGLDVVNVGDEYSPENSDDGNSYRLGIYDGTTIIHGTLNEDITSDTYSNSIVNYPDNAFGSADQGSLKLFLNGNEIHSVDLFSFTDSTCDYHDSNTVTMDDTSSLKVNMQVTGTDIPDNTTITSIPNGTTFIMSNSATSADAVTNKTLTFILGNGDSLNTNSSGFKGLSAAISGKFSSDAEFDNFKYRTGAWRVWNCRPS